MQYKPCISFLLFCLFTISSYSQTVLQGKVTDNDGAVIGAAIQLFQDNKQIKVVSSDFDGNYHFIMETSGNYTLLASSIGNIPIRIQNIPLVENETKKVNVSLAPAEGLEGKVTIIEYKVPLIEFDICCPGLTNPTSSLPVQVKVRSQALICGLNTELKFDHDENLPFYPHIDRPLILFDLNAEENEDNNIQVRIPPKAKLDSLTIYPNPVLTDNRFTVKTASEFDEFQLFSMNGQLISNGKFEAINELQIIAPDAAGIYAIRLFLEDEQLIAIGSVVVVQ